MEQLEPYGEGLEKPLFRTTGFPKYIRQVGENSSSFAFSRNVEGKWKYFNFFYGLRI